MDTPHIVPSKENRSDLPPDSARDKLELRDSDLENAALQKLQADSALELWNVRKTAPPALDHAWRHVNEILSTPMAKPQEKEWVAVFNVAIKNYGASNRDNLTYRREQLASIAAQTKDKPVSVLLQLTVADSVDQEVKGNYSKLVGVPFHLERYVISDGKMTALPSVNSHGTSEDTTAILSLSRRLFEAKKLALICDLHGIGNVGVVGDAAGLTSLDEFADAIQAGLGDRKLDMLDFEACLMGQDGVLDRVASLTDHVVASAAVEGPRGQNFAQSLAKVLENPKETNGDDYAEIIVDDARRHKLVRILQGDGSYTDPTVFVKTMAHFDMKGYAKFRRAQDAFGEALCKTIEIPANREVIDTIIAETRCYSSNREKRDIQRFTERVLDAVATDKLPDPGGALRIHGGLLLDAHKRLVVSFSGFERFLGQGGLSTFLPSREFLNKDGAEVLKAYRSELVDKSSGWSKFRRALLDK